MNKDKFNPTGERHSAWVDVALQEEMLRQQQEELMRRQLELAQQKEDLSRYDDSQNKAFFDNLNNIKEKFPELSVDHMENYAMEIRDKNSEISKLESLLNGNISMTEYHQVKQQIEAARAIVESREKMLNALLNKKKENGYGGRADIIDSYIESIVNGGKSVSEVESSKNDTDSKVDAEPEDINDNINEQVAQSYKIDKENLEKLKNSKNHIKISKENKAESVSDNRLDEIREQFDEAVRNGASGIKLAQINNYFYREALRKNHNNGKGDLELSGDDARDYENMEKVVSAIKAEERESQNKLNQEQPKNQTQDPENLGNFKRKWRKFGGFVKDFISNPIVKKVMTVGAVITAFGAGLYVGRADTDNNDSYEPKIEHTNNDSQFKQDKSNYDDAIKDVIEHNKDTEKNNNLSGNGRYDKENDTYWSEMNRKRSIEDIGNYSTFSEKTAEEIMEMHKNGSLEDNLTYRSQPMFVKGIAEKYFGISTDQAQDLYLRAQKGDTEAFKKIDEGFKKMVADTDHFAWDGITPSNFSSFFGDKDDDGNITMATAHNLNYKDKLLKWTLKDGTVIRIDGTCTQFVMDGETIPEIPTIEELTPNDNYTPPPENPSTPENPGEELEAKNPKVDINVNGNLNPEAKSSVNDNKINTTEGNQYESSAQDADHNMIYGGNGSTYQAPPVYNFTQDDRDNNTIADLSKAEPQDVIKETPSVDKDTGQSKLSGQELETGGIIDTSGNTYNIETNNTNVIDGSTNMTPDTNIDDSSKVGSLNGATDQNGVGSNSERVNGF